jgi:hypothetical protein
MKTTTLLACLICGATGRESETVNVQPKCADWCPGRGLRRPTYRRTLAGIGSVSGGIAAQGAAARMMPTAYAAAMAAALDEARKRAIGGDESHG